MSVSLLNTSSTVYPMQSQDKNVDAVKETTLFQRAINAFSTDLYQQMSQIRSKENRNFVFFTPNVVASLSMLYAGAPKKLKNTMEETLYMGELKEGKWHTHFNHWSMDIQKRGSAALQKSSLAKTDQIGFNFQQTQMIAVHKDTLLMESATNHLLKYKPEFLLFKNPEEARTLINEKVAEKTEGKIQDLIENIPEDLVLIMASVALFKGKWQYPFNKAENSKEVFYNSDNTKVHVEMMNQEIDDLRTALHYNADEDTGYSVAVLELPFHGQLTLLLIKPDAKPPKCAETLQRYMTQWGLQNLLERYENLFSDPYSLTIQIPKLILQDKTNLLTELSHTPWAQALLNADFNQTLVDAGFPTRAPQLASEVHFHMDEEGAKAAAASYSAISSMGSDNSEFNVHGPFGLAIVDRTTQTILGMGQVLKMDGEPVQTT